MNVRTMRAKALAHMSDAQALVERLQDEFLKKEWSEDAHQFVTFAGDRLRDAAEFLSRTPRNPDATTTQENDR